MPKKLPNTTSSQSGGAGLATGGGGQGWLFSQRSATTTSRRHVRKRAENTDPSYSRVELSSGISNSRGGIHNTSPFFASLSVEETQEVAEVDPTALRAFLLPNYLGVATSFTELLMRVVQRCKRDDQVRLAASGRFT